jgi:hypothetical protein
MKWIIPWIIFFAVCGVLIYASVKMDERLTQDCISSGYVRGTTVGARDLVPACVDHDGRIIVLRK